MRTRLWLSFIVWLSLAIPAGSAAGLPDGIPAFKYSGNRSEDWAFIDNGQVRLGVIRSSGAGIGWFSESGSDRNLVNHWDRGRLIQQSYYGRSDGSLWDRQPWRWNPVQGGDWKGHPARVLELRTDRDSLHARSIPVHWASGEELTNCLMEQTITLTGKVAHVHYRFTYAGTENHPTNSQEIPAFFVDPRLDRLAVYDGTAPWTGGALSFSQPGWPNESRRITEGWAAYVDPKNYGIGAYVPIARELTCYRFGKAVTDAGACSYFAPLTRFAVHPGFHFEYDLYLTLGKVDEIRAAFKKVRDLRQEGRETTR